MNAVEIPKSYVFKGTKEYTSQQLQDMLSLSILPSLNQQPQNIGLKQQSHFPQGASRFLVPIQACLKHLTSLINSLKKDPWPVESDKRPLRSTGCALYLAVSLLEVVFSF